MNGLNKPIFIGGSGRSGTSILFKILAKHPNNFSFGGLESKFFIANDGLLDLHSALSQNYNIGRARGAVKRFRILMNKLKVDGVYGKDGLDRYLGKPAMYDKILHDFLKEINGQGNIPKPYNEQEINQAYRTFLVRMINHIRGCKPTKRFVEKTPHNFLHLDFFFNLFPNLKFVHIIRDPRAVALSLTKQTWAPDSYEDCCWWLYHVYTAYVNQNGFEKYTKPHQFLQIKLEDMGSEKQGSIKNKLENFLELPDLQINQETISPDKINYWKDSITKDQLFIANKILGRYLEYFDYPEKVN